MADHGVELDSLLPRALSHTTSDYGEQTAATHVQPITANQDISLGDLPPLPLSGPSSSNGRGQSLSNPPSIRASSASAHANFAATPQPPANVPLVDLVGTRLQSMIGLLQETVNALSQAAPTERIAEADTASLEEVVVDESETMQSPFLERVEVMSEEEIVAYDKKWSCGWKDDREGKEAGADSWKIIWPEQPMSGDPWNTLQFYPCAKDERTALQLQLLAALYKPGLGPSTFISALYTHGPLISAIGFNLSKVERRWYTPASDRSRQEWFSPQRLVRILIEVVRQVRKSPHLFRVGDVLWACYSRGLLRQPADFGSYRDHVQLICRAADLANIRHEGFWFEDLSPAFPEFLGGYSTTDQLLQIPILDLMQATEMLSMDLFEDLPCADGEVFRVNDLSLRTLKVIGELTVEWTMYWDQHLLLDLRRQHLKIAWFTVDPIRSACDPFEPTMEYASVKFQVLKTYGFLFRSSFYGKKSKSQNRDYGSLPAPPWMILFGRSTLRSWDKLSDQCKPQLGWDDFMHTYLKYKSPDPDSDYMCEDIRNQLKGTQGYWDKTEGQLNSHTYSSYPNYEGRLRVLRAYMDSKKPKGFRGLWKDKRDTYSYYTFWGVIIFGGTSVLLGLLSLVASVLQTIASWKALEPPSQGSHP